jgi:hypothetical protein
LCKNNKQQDNLIKEEQMEKKSEMDKLFYLLYGYYPTKAGRAYEMITSATLKILNKGTKVLYDQNIEGIYSKQSYQIDGVLGKTAIEAKDHTLKKKKVGRPEVQVLGGGLPDLPLQNGIFASATGYTNNAKKYTEGTVLNPTTKNIDLYEIRLSTKEDGNGRITTFVIEIILTLLDDKNGKYTPVFTKEGYATIGKLFPEGNNKIPMNCIYNADGTVHMTINKWLNTLLSEIPFENKDDTISGKLQLEGKHICINDKYIGIKCLEYEIPIKRPVHIVEIKQEGKACLYVKNDKGTVDTLLTDIQLKEVIFDENTKEVKLL